MTHPGQPCSFCLERRHFLCTGWTHFCGCTSGECGLALQRDDDDEPEIPTPRGPDDRT